MLLTLILTNVSLALTPVINYDNIDNAFTNIEMLHGIPNGLLKAICTVETQLKLETTKNMDTNYLFSHGICQVQEGALKQALRVDNVSQLQLKALEKPMNNINVAALYLTYQYKRYRSWDKAIIAYNAGRVIENKRYLNKVKKVWRNK